jgi:gluconolactonase
MMNSYKIDWIFFAIFLVSAYGALGQEKESNQRETAADSAEPPLFVIKDKPEFDRIVSTDEKVEKLAGGFRFVEGPVWIPEDEYLLFSDIPANEIKKWQNDTLTTFRKPSHHTNGNLLDERGRLISCEHGTRRVTRTLKDGKVEVLVDRYGDKKLNSPNDLAIRSDGTLWFTDPPYGLKGRKKELAGNNVFCFQPRTGALNIVAHDFDRPNGLCLSPDEKRLYIADSGRPCHIRVFDVQSDGSLMGGRIFCKIDKGGPDGIRCDQAGRVLSSAGDGVHIFTPSGKLVGKILVPETPANLCFGGKDGKILFITARTSLYAIRLKMTGAG